MHYFSAALRTAIAAHHGIVTRREMVDDGMSLHELRHLVRIGAITRCHDGVYRVTTSPETFESRCVAACSADPSIVITGTAAGWLWGFRHVRTPTMPIVLSEHDRHPLATGVLVRRTNLMRPHHRVDRADGIVIASPPRTWFDCARDLGDDTFEALTEWVIDRHASTATIWHTFRELEARGRPGVARVRRVLSQRSAWQKPAGSKLELRVLNALRAAGVPELVRQHRLRLPNGIVIHPDGADPTIRWAVEVDHVTWHGGRLDAQRDKSRDRGLRRIGWQVERVTDQELRTSFAAVIAELVDLHRIRTLDLAA
ncbi:hypothetical protein [Ilumatobacter sp.]|uniref:hypothetical protein n=1 Tax=Ilumatobacter sp. TaxID=1967498 RepID=UPI003C497E0C